MATQADAAFQQAYALHRQGRFDEAGLLYQQVLQLQPRHFQALHLFGVMAAQTNHPDRAAELIGEAILIDPQSVAAHNNHGNALCQLNRHAAALQSYDRAIALKSDYADAHYNRANALRVLGFYEAAVASYDRVVALSPNNAAAHHNRGNGLFELRQYEAAIASHDQAIALKPDYADAYDSRGNARRALKQYESAIASFDEAIALSPNNAQFHYNRAFAFIDLAQYETAIASFDVAIAIRSDYTEAYSNRGNAYRALAQFESAIASYDRAIAISPENAEAHYNRGVALLDLKQYEAAVASYDAAIAFKPDYAEAHANRGFALFMLLQYGAAIASHDKAIAFKPDCVEAYINRGTALCKLLWYEPALASYDKAITLSPNNAEAHYCRAVVLVYLERHEAAIASFDKALALRADFEFSYGARLGAKMQICDWADFGAAVARLATSIQRNEPASEPFLVVALMDSAPLQKMAAQIWVQHECPPNPTSPRIPKRNKHDKIRIGYFSGDFREHPVSMLTAELFETHDRSKFELSAFSFGPDTQDKMRLRMEGAFNRFIDLRTASDQDIALHARSMEIDIAIDLGGLTHGGRPGIFATRAAPLQVSYLGYSGTMGAEYIDYLVADPTVIPESSRCHYSEKIIYLPHSYLVNDSKRNIADRVFTRQELELPQTGFVFCCFNGSYKITPDTFDGWMRILRRVENSVLWLSEGNSATAGNLRKEAVQRGVNAERLIFAKPVASLAEHLARQRAADLFLDTLPYNAHTTASDALWAGLPVLTCMGDAFAGRVAASLLNAIGLPELIAPTRAQFEDLAVELACNSHRLAAIKQKLADNRLTTPLFDTQLFTKNLESAFTEIYERYQADLPTEHILVV
jgi:protein O-GlcNAc transferase